MDVLLSIKPEFADQILNGSKRFEYRKAAFKYNAKTRVLIYATMPIGKIIGEFAVDQVLKASPEELWNDTHHHSGISRERFLSYFEGRAFGVAIGVKKARKYAKPVELSSLTDGVAPQSFRYIPRTTRSF
jgi:predicted transcriptional regulator